MHPLIEINLEAIQDNAKRVVNFCRAHGIEVVGVTKGVCGDPKVANSMMKGGVKILADSRIQNIRKMQEAGINAEFMLIRQPMLSEVREVVEFTDYSLNTELETLRKLSSVAEEIGKIHRVIIMVDVGDRREGLMPQDLVPFLEKAKELKGIKIVGIGTNVGCFGGVLPTVENQSLLVKLAEKARKIIGDELSIISSGGTVVLKLLEDGELPKGINQLRIGEAILLGTDSTGNRMIPWLRHDTFTIKAEVIEVKKKPSLPEGPIGKDAFGHTPTFEDRGVRKRAILAIGRQDVDIEGLKPLEKGIEVLGGSSDHTIVDVEELPSIKVGDVLSFRPNYSAMLRAMTSEYVEKKYLE